MIHKKKVLAKKISAKIFLEKNILHCRRTLTLTACDFLKIVKVYSQQEKHLSRKCFVPFSVHFIRFFINIIIIWDHIQMPNIFHDKTVYNKLKKLEQTSKEQECLQILGNFKKIHLSLLLPRNLPLWLYYVHKFILTNIFL